MEKRLTDAQLEKIVAEVQELSDRQQAELTETQVRDILQELNLPPDLLEEATIQLHRREALAARKRRNRLLVGGMGAAIALLIVGGIALNSQHQQARDRVTAQSDRLTLSQAGSSIDALARQAAGQEVFYSMTLAEAPVGQKLALSCQWRDPSGQIVHENRYQTRTITSPVWNTHCRYRLPGDAPTGLWKVESFLGDRPLSNASFTVK